MSTKQSKGERTEELILSGADEAAIWENVRGLAFTQVRKYPNSDWDDLMQECFFAMRSAIEHWNPEKGAFSTVFRQWIFNHIQKYYANTSYLTPALWERVQKVKRFQQKYYTERGEMPSIEEITEAVKIKKTWLPYVFKGIVNAHPAALDETLKNCEDMTGKEALVDPNDLIADIEAAEDKSILSEAVKDALGSLQDRNCKMLVRFFGLDGAPPRTMQQIGEEFGLSKQRVSQIIKKTIERIGVSKECPRLKAYYDCYLYDRGGWK